MDKQSLCNNRSTLIVSYLMTYFTLRDNPTHETKPNRLLPTDSFQWPGHLPSERVLYESAVPNKNSERLDNGAPWKDIQTAHKSRVQAGIQHHWKPLVKPTILKEHPGLTQEVMMENIPLQQCTLQSSTQTQIKTVYLTETKWRLTSDSWKTEIEK